MTPIHGSKRECLQRARDLLATGRPIDLIYAALDLRLCLEAMTYEKLRSFENMLPPSLLDRTWQAPQLLRAMTQLDPSADKPVQIFAGVETTPGTPADPADMHFIGDHKAFGLPWLRKQYNKLGSMLHVDRSDQTLDESKLTRDLADVAAEIGEAQQGSILGSWFGEIVPFNCQLCGQKSMANLHFIETERRANCLNPSCEAEYNASPTEGGAVFLLRAIQAACPHCSAQNLVETRHLESGRLIICAGCERRMWARGQWQFEPAPEVPVGS